MKKGNKSNNISSNNKSSHLLPGSPLASDTISLTSETNGTRAKESSQRNSVFTKQASMKIRESSISRGEDEIMMKGGRSELLERNLNQMVDVLHNRLKDLSAAATLRIQLSNDDPKGDQRTESINAPRIGKELEEILPKHRDLSKGHKDNSLVTSEGVTIDPVKLVVKTKGSTEAAKRLEGRLEETFGNMAAIRDIIGKKSKNSSTARDEASRLIEQNKSEAKRQLRADLEKELFSIMENHVSRSILEATMVFKAPDSQSENNQVLWPISIKWPKRDKRSNHPGNIDGEMNTDLILRYAVERITLPSGEALFRRLTRQSIVQDYFIHLFWLVKLKLFRHVNEDDKDEAWLLTQLSLIYSQLLTVVGQRAKEEYEKDFVFNYLPYIFSNAIYFSFYFLCPGSRHLYTKGFRKTIYMQIVMIMFGIQLCPAAVKIAWTKVFPEDFHDEESNGVLAAIEELKSTAGGGGNTNSARAVRGESIPVPIAYACAKRAFEKAEKLMTTSKSKHKLTSISELQSPMEQALEGSNRRFKGVLSDGLDEETYRQYSHKSVVDAAIAAASKALQVDSSTKVPEKTSLGQSSVSKTSLDREDQKRALSPPQIISTSEAFDGNPTQSDYASQIPSSLSQGRPLIPLEQPEKTQPMSNSFVYWKLAEENPLFRTNLLPLDERPRHLRANMTRQIPDSIDAKRVSPLLAQYLRISSDAHTTDASTDIWVDDDMNELQKKSQPSIQKLRRTVPVSWCRVGGANTYRRLAKTLTSEHIEELTQKSEEAQKQFQRETIHSIIQRAKTIETMNEKYHKVLTSGSQKISRFALDVLKQQQKSKGVGNAGNHVILPSTMSTNITIGNASSKTPTLGASKSKELGEPQLDEDLAIVTAAAQLDKEDLLEEFLELLQ